MTRLDRAFTISLSMALWALRLTVVAGVAAPFAVAEQPWDSAPFSADPKAVMEAAAAIPVKEGVDVICLREDGSYVLEPDGRTTYTWRLVYRIVTARAVEGWSLVQTRWEPWHQARPTIRARVITADGVEHVLDPKTIGEFPASQAAADILDDRRVLRAPLPGVGAGAVVEEEIVIAETAPLFGAGVVRYFYYGAVVPTERSHLVLDAPASLPLRFVTRLLPDVTPQREEVAGRVRLTFDCGHLEPFEPFDPLIPSDQPQRPFVAFSVGKSWAEVATRYAQIVDTQIAAGPVQDLVKKELVEAMAKDANISRLLARLHRDIRYTGLEFGDATIIPRPPAETLQRKYGDCKDKATFLVAMLRAAGIDAYVALVNTGPGPDMEKELPGLGPFDHAIVYVPGPPPLWIEATDEFARPGQLPVGDQGRLALIASAKTTELVRTPVAVSTDNQIIETREFFLAEEGKARVVEETEWRGARELFFRRDYARAGEKNIRESLEKYGKSVYLAESISNVEYPDPHDLSKPFRLRLEAKEARRGWTSWEDAGVAILLGNIADLLPQRLRASKEEEKEKAEAETPGATKGKEKPKTDVVLPEPFVSELRYRIVPPPGYVPRPLPANATERLGPATLSKEFKADDNGVVTATFRFDTVKSRLTPDEAEALRKGIQELKEAEATLVTYESVGEAHLQAGRIREALAEFRRLATLSPEKSLHRSRIAMALLDAGLGERAREEARQAIALQPTATAYRRLGWILQHDLVGRRFEKGFDLEGALVAYRKALELDSADSLTRIDLAILLEHDTQGVRYSPRAKLDAAIAEYRLLKDNLGPSSSYFNNLPFCLMYARRFKELREFLREHPEKTPTTNVLLLVVVAGTEGAEAGLREATKSISGEETRRNAILGAADNLVRLRLYPEAAAFLTVGAKGASNAVDVLARASTIRKAKHHEDITYPETDPRSVVTKMLKVLTLPAGEGDFLSLLANELRDEVKKEEEREESLRKILRITQSMSQRLDIPAEVLLDTGLANVQMTTEGNEALGYRVRLRAPVSTSGIGNVFFVTLEDRQCHIVATDEIVEATGTEILRRAEAGDLAGARRWLDWVREEVSLPGGDDPLAGLPFPSFWTKGSQAGLEEIRYAAASLMAAGPGAERAIPILREGLEKAASDEVRSRFNLALIHAFEHRKQFAEIVPIARQLLQSHPDSASAFRALCSSLSRTKQWDECRKVAEERLKRLPDDLWGTRILSQLEFRQGNMTRAEELEGGLVERGKAEAPDYNNRAWFTLFTDHATDQAIEDAQQAVSLTRGENGGVLHTLACLLAELGKTTEAREVILKAMEVEGMDEPEPTYWYVFGRIAEQYGESEAARIALLKVTPPKNEYELPDSTYRLAEKRLAILGPEAKAAEDSTKRN